jgi:hypothetical protein
MKIRSIIYNKLWLALCAGTLLFSCEKESDEWLRNNTRDGRGYFPVIASLGVASPANVLPGSEVILDLRYWSLDPVKEVSLFSQIGTGPEELVVTTPYMEAYSAITRTDSLMLRYTVPATVAPATKITLRVQVQNENELTKSQKTEITVK